VTVDPDAWFPRPSALDALTVVGPGPRTRSELYSLLGSPLAVEMRAKSGVAGAADGSARATTRLLDVDGVVLKLHHDRPHATRALAVAAAERTRIAGERAAVWHPDKQWFVLAHRASFFVVSACPRLLSIRALRAPTERLAAFGDAVARAAEVGARESIGLDLNPSNFGVDRAGASRAPYYIDDELYPPSSGRDLGEAMAARIPEEPALDPVAWSEWGWRTIAAVRKAGLSREQLAQLAAGIESYPLVEALEPRRRGLLAGARDAVRSFTTARRGATVGDRVCVLADVHGNALALEAVLARAKEAGVDSYLFLGDAVGYGPRPTQCVARIAELPGLVAVRGNHDDALAAGAPSGEMNRDARAVLEWSLCSVSHAQRRWLAALPLELRAEDFLAVHGAPRDPARMHGYVYEMTFRENLDVLAATGTARCFYGHTHVPFAHGRTRDGRSLRCGARDPEALGEPFAAVLVNPGSVGQPRDGDPRASFAIWDRRARSISFLRVGYDVDRVVGELARLGLPRDLGVRLEMGR
jgi:diadenosine tetraphosphatase ApaH/serine/threonine PP2A family protein phosphatase